VLPAEKGYSRPFDLLFFLARDRKSISMLSDIQGMTMLLGRFYLAREMILHLCYKLKLETKGLGDGQKERCWFPPSERQG
jgi:hypothetical protein